MSDREPYPWDPFGGKLFGRWPFRSAWPAGGGEDFWGPGRGFAPAVDVSENEERYIVIAELPGTRREDVHIEIQDGTLTIRGEKRSQREERSEHRRHVERSFGSFRRSFSLPASADPDRVDARFEDGVLTIDIPKRPRAAPRSVEIRGGEPGGRREGDAT